MHIILGIHSSDQDAKTIARFVSKSLKTDPNTYFLNFEYSHSAYPLDLKTLSALTRGKRSHIVNIPARNGCQTELVAYAQSLREVLVKLKSRLGKEETVKATSIGGSARLCFEGVNGSFVKNKKTGAQLVLEHVFGKKLSGQNSYLPLIYGSKYPDALYKERMKKRRSVVKTRKSPQRRRL